MRFVFTSLALTALLWTVCPLTTEAQAKAPAVPKGAAVKNALPVDVEGIEFFEKKIRPVLAQNCYACHSAASKKTLGNLTLDTRSGLLKGGVHGPALVPGESGKSRLIEAVQYTSPDLKMPPKGKLPDAVLADLEAWITRGAPWPEAPALNSAEKIKAVALADSRRRHWAFQAVRNPLPPAVKRKAWPRNAIDQFILAKLEAKGMLPAPAADRCTLLRRAYFDLLGLPPTPEEVEAFLKDRSPDAYEKLIDRLLASPHYGERWGRFWLDVARYGEDQAHSFEPRLYPQGFRYRDWVAHALNTDMPYDRFVKEQIAADLFNEPDRQDQLPALGFFALGPVYYGDSKMYDQYDDRIDTLSRGFLGLTVACARCHDHKFDPITQKDYYALAGVFASTAYVEVPLNSPSAQKQSGKNDSLVNRNDLINAKQAEVDKFYNEQAANIRSGLTPDIARYMVAAWKLHNRRKASPKLTTEEFAATEKVESLVLDRWMKFLTDKAEKDRPLLAAWRQRLSQEETKDLSSSAEALAAVQKIAGNFQAGILSLIQRRDAAAPSSKTGAVSAAGTAKTGVTPLEKSEAATLEEIVGPEGVLTLPKDQFDKLLVGDPKVHYATIKSALERLKMGSFIHALTEGTKIANVPVLLRGNPDTPGEEAPRHFLTVLAGDSAPLFKQGSGRLDLANAIADRNNPLTARVMVNRIWQHHFGTGLVRTTSNFGLLGERPTHPELLDYLASQFMEHGWSLKTLHRQIMLSAAYQMSSAQNPRNDGIDPGNTLLWRVSRRRLEIEAWRDAMLAVSGKLDETVGGPSQSLASPENCRRTFYAAVSRHDLDSMLRLFDFPDPNVTTDARVTTTVPLQQLFVLNSEFMIRQAKTFAAKMTSVSGEADSARIRRAFLLLYSRPPTETELHLGMTFLLGPHSSSHTTPDVSSGAVSAPPAAVSSRLTRWEQYAQALLSANEFLYID